MNRYIISSKEWKNIESPLIRLDPAISKFVYEKGLPILHNTRCWPNREIRWNYQIERLIEIYCEKDEISWTLHVSAYDYQNSKRLRRDNYILKAVRFDELEIQLGEKLNEAYKLVCSWKKEDLNEFDI